MLQRSIIAGTALLIICGPALALDQSTSANSQNSQTPSSTSNQATQNLPQELKQKLQQQGFSDVKIVPGSFIVSAKDKSGDPVSMVIGPHSMTMFTFANDGTGSTTGSGSTSQNNSGTTSK